MKLITYPNQKTIKINKEAPEKTKGNRSYIIAYNDNIEAAAGILSGSGFKLYIYLLSNQNWYEMALSPADFAAKYGLCLKTAQAAVKELEEKRFIVRSNGNKYCFYDKQQPGIEIEPENPVRKLFRIDGAAQELTYKELVAMAGSNAETLWKQAREANNNEN